MRAVLDDRGFLEVQTPLLVPGTCPDRAIESFEVPGAGEARGESGYLVSSTEYQLKRLYAEGVPAAYTLGPNFRRGDLGQFHNPEFTMLEWGRAGATMAEVEAEAEALVRAAAVAVGAPIPGTFARVDLRDLLAAVFGQPIRAWIEIEYIAGPFAPNDDAQYAWVIDRALATLNSALPTWIVGWPARMTASAGLDPADPTVTLRSELYWRGLELADGFPFCNDAAWQRARTREENAIRAALGQVPIREDIRFLEAVAQLPTGAGMAMGVDRLCLALLGGERLTDVMSFGWGGR